MTMQGNTAAGGVGWKARMAPRMSFGSSGSSGRTSSRRQSQVEGEEEEEGPFLEAAKTRRNSSTSSSPSGTRKSLRFTLKRSIKRLIPPSGKGGKSPDKPSDEEARQDGGRATGVELGDSVTLSEEPASSDAREKGDDASSSNNRSKENEPPQSNFDSSEGRSSTEEVVYEDPRETEKDILRRRKYSKDGFCRQVDSYDGQVIIIDDVPTYQIGNYLGDGVAGVVYEGRRLLPLDQYPVRSGIAESIRHSRGAQDLHFVRTGPRLPFSASSFLCAPASTDILCQGEWTAPQALPPRRPSTPLSAQPGSDVRDVMRRAASTTALIDLADGPDDGKDGVGEELVITDGGAMSAKEAQTSGIVLQEQAFLDDENVAIKILNPVVFHLISQNVAQTAVLVRPGDPMEEDVISGENPMEERHVSWVVNPNSRNLKTLQRPSRPLAENTEARSGENGQLPHSRASLSPGDNIDRGTPERGLRLSLVAAFVDPKTNVLRELPLAKCVEIWGHPPFTASESEFDAMIDTIEGINAGASKSQTPSQSDGPADATNPQTEGGESEKAEVSTRGKNGKNGLTRALKSQRQTVFCKPLNAYIAIPAVPPKYLRWLRQRRAATKEIRNMVLIGRHRNVVHLYEVLELIQDNKSTMFLILELVRGGELFDLISNNQSSAKEDGGQDIDDSEVIMLKFFRELASGIAYCHDNGIAHRDLKPENLLVHNEPGGERTLKIADFGLSAAFALTEAQLNSLSDSPDSPPGTPVKDMASSEDDNEELRVSRSALAPIFRPMQDISTLGASALSFLTCGGLQDVACGSWELETEGDAKPLRRMTSIVGSPHYVPPEIISQSEDAKNGTKDNDGYDGTKADVWSAGVTLYAMLFRSLPFGEDLMSCPRYQSFSRWYQDARQRGTRRASGEAALEPFTNFDEEDLGPQWFFPSNKSAESKDLIVAMLNPDPDHRLSINMVLVHPWLTTPVGHLHVPP